MKRFLLFSGVAYYPDCGWNDFVGSFDTQLEAESAPKRGEWWQVVDTLDNPRIIAFGYENYPVERFP